MQEEQASGAQVAEGDSSAEQVAPQTFIENGKFLPGWKEHYIPEEMRADKVFDTFDDVAGGLKMLGSVQGMIGKKGIVVPGEASPPTEWDNFYRELGRPDTKDQYQMKVPDDLLEIYNDNTVAKARDIFHGLGFNQKQVDALWSFEEERTRAVMQLQANEILEKDNAFAEWGVVNPKKKHGANRMIQENSNDEEHKKALLEALDNNIAFGELLFNLSTKLGEHKGVNETGQITSTTAVEASTEAKKIEATPGFLLPDDKGQLLKDTNRVEYDRLRKERDRLYEIAYPKKPG